MATRTASDPNDHVFFSHPVAGFVSLFVFFVLIATVVDVELRSRAVFAEWAAKSTVDLAASAAWPFRKRVILAQLPALVAAATFLASVIVGRFAGGRRCRIFGQIGLAMMLTGAGYAVMNAGDSIVLSPLFGIFITCAGSCSLLIACRSMRSAKPLREMLIFIPVLTMVNFSFVGVKMEHAPWMSDPQKPPYPPPISQYLSYAIGFLLPALMPLGQSGFARVKIKHDTLDGWRTLPPPR